MAIYSEYLSQLMSFDQITIERKKQLKRISDIRKRGIIVYASDLNKASPNSIDYSDIAPFSDQLSVLNGDSVDIILETPGGLAEVVEDLVDLVRSKFQKVGIIIPGTAKSAGTIFTMAADEIFMGEQSALGPIDAQIMSNGKRYSADAFLEGFKKIKCDAEKNKRLELAYIPILQNISPGEIQHCENAQALSRKLVTNWLKEYKFKFWDIHKSSQTVVTEEDKIRRAEEIASLLCAHNHWLSHGRSIKLKDLRDMKLIINDYRENQELNDAITRYYILLKMSFETQIYKIYETPETQIYRSLAPLNNQIPNAVKPNNAMVVLKCNACNTESKIQANFIAGVPLENNAHHFPVDNIFECPKCNQKHDLSIHRIQIEKQFNMPII